MAPKAGYYTPLLHVKSIEDSILFYALLGFETVDRTGERGRLGWARMHCEGGAVMFLRAEEPRPARKREVLFAMYTPDLPAFRDLLLAGGIAAPPIAYPEYMPSGTIEIADPDGYVIAIHHWSGEEHARWEKERKIRLSEF